MPLYEYECGTCGARFELIRKFSDPPVTECIKCGSEVRRLVSSPAFQLKGAGWYVSDYGRKAGDQEKRDKGAAEDKGGKADKSDKADSSEGAGKADTAKDSASKSDAASASSDSKASTKESKSTDAAKSKD